MDELESKVEPEIVFDDPYLDPDVRAIYELAADPENRALADRYEAEIRGDMNRPEGDHDPLEGFTVWEYDEDGNIVNADEDDDDGGEGGEDEG